MSYGCCLENLEVFEVNSRKRLIVLKNSHLRVEAYTNVDWAGLITNRRSILGHYTIVGGNVVTWRSKKQHVVA